MISSLVLLPPFIFRFSFLSNICSISMKRLVVGSSSTHQHHQKTVSEEIIIDILLRLPVKTLGIFKCVSKKWNKFISCDPYFRKHYTQVGGSPLMLGIFQQLSKTLPIEFGSSSLVIDQTNIIAPPFHESLASEDHQPLQLVLSSNGVLLLCSKSRLDPSNYYICNPITKECFPLPTPSQNTVVATGFIWNQNSDHYKIIRTVLTGRLLSSTMTIQILDSQMLDQPPQWKEYILTCSKPFAINLDTTAIITEKLGLVYWLVYTGKTSAYGFVCDGVVVFDPNREGEQFLQLDMIKLPGGIREGYMGSEIGQVNGNIVYAQNNTHTIDIWVLDEEIKEWSLRYNVENPNQNFLFIEAFHPLDPHLLLVWLKGETLVWYNLQTENMDLFNMGFFLTGSSSIFRPYVCLKWPPSSLLFN